MSRNFSQETPNGKSRPASEKPRPSTPSCVKSASPGAAPPSFGAAKTAPVCRPCAAPCGPSAAVRAVAQNPPAASATAAAPTHEQIAERARSIWTAGGCVPGRDLENWRQAERQLREELRRSR
ncbi:MAG: DUF2934 domain-containing protein [Planctomycetota bacterium]|nr:DUF2934 domain-containing protein [Planctomycetota bacterium]